MGMVRPGSGKMRDVRLHTRLLVLLAVCALATANLAGISTAQLEDEETVGFDAPAETVAAPADDPAPPPEAAPAPAPDPAPGFPLSGPVLGQGSGGSEVELLQR